MRWTLLIALFACTADPKGVDPVADSASDAPETSPMDPVRLKDRDGDGSLAGKDCDDYNAAIYPDAEEICDAIDNDCDGEVDEDFHLDADGDGYGAVANVICTTELPTATNGDDCDDTNPDAYPGAEEVCDGENNDCDGQVDEAMYPDADGDGYGDGDAPCVEGGANVSRSNDCDDTSAAVYPGADEVCDGLDNDCDEAIDEGYTDVDGDGYGDADRACTAGDSLVREDGDCDDDDATVYPYAREICDDKDNDCDVQVDDLASFEDLDGDGWGGARRGPDCSPSVSYLDQGGDCDDSSAAVYPGADEVCDGVDNDCDGEGDEELAWTDADGDGYGETERTGDCDPTVTYASVGDDCDGADASVHPYACDDCDGLDNDCDGGVDEGSADGKTRMYLDEDRDGYGGDDDDMRYGCYAGDPWVLVGGDCDDATETLNPDMAEICQDGVDNDCDGLLDCEDDDCGDADCSETDCSDGVDGDQDGYLDCQDDDCWGVECGYAVATVTGGRLAGAVTTRARQRSDDATTSTSARFSGSATGRVVAYSAGGAAVATCDWRVGQIVLWSWHKAERWVSTVGIGCGSRVSTTWDGSCAGYYRSIEDCLSHRAGYSSSASGVVLARDSVSVEPGCGVSDGDILPPELELLEGRGWRTEESASWYGGAWSTSAVLRASSTLHATHFDRTEIHDIQLLLSEASSFQGPLDP